MAYFTETPSFFSRSPISRSAWAKGEVPASISFQGTTETMRKMESTKKIRMRKETEMVIFAIVLEPSSDSAAASVAISAPQSEKIVVATPANIAATPAGAKPPCAVRFAKVDPDGDVTPVA